MTVKSHHCHTALPAAESLQSYSSCRELAASLRVDIGDTHLHICAETHPASWALYLGLWGEPRGQHHLGLGPLQVHPQQGRGSHSSPREWVKLGKEAGQGPHSMLGPGTGNWGKLGRRLGDSPTARRKLLHLDPALCPGSCRYCGLSPGAALDCLLGCEGFRAGDQEPLDSRLDSSGWGEREETSLRLPCPLSTSLRLWQWGQSPPPRSTGSVTVTATQRSGRLCSVAKELLFVLR